MPSAQELNRKRQELEQAKKAKDQQIKNLKSQMADENGNPGDCYLALLGRSIEESWEILDQLKDVKKQLFSIL
jgi:sugar-specific transcriptional regulator TrmB